jgi:hypothetical protein
MLLVLRRYFLGLGENHLTLILTIAGVDVLLEPKISSLRPMLPGTALIGFHIRYIVFADMSNVDVTKPRLGAESSLGGEDTYYTSRSADYPLLQIGV